MAHYGSELYIAENQYPYELGGWLDIRNNGLKMLPYYAEKLNKHGINANEI